MDGPVDRRSLDVQLLRSPWEVNLADLVTSPDSFLLLASPYITCGVAQRIGELLSRRNGSSDLRVLCLTNIRVESVLSGSLELEAIVELGRTFRNFMAVHLPALHAKVFVADYKCAIVTSGNLTQGGLSSNYEYGVLLRRPDLVREVRLDFEGYARLGAPLTVREIAEFGAQLADLRREFQLNQRRMIKVAGEGFKNKLRKAEDQVLRFRARSSNQAVFRETIEYLLSKGPLRTAELHPLVQKMHPDLCDDSVDRVIDGVNFGKKWKHLVRTAQQSLKRDGRVRFDGSRWFLTAGGGR